jgi:hypothetical protein
MRQLRGEKVRVWRHRDGGFVLQLFGSTWLLEASYARHRRDRYGRGEPVKLHLTTGMTP